MIKAQRGTKDILPDEILTWQDIQKKAQELFQRANYKEKIGRATRLNSSH